MKYLGGKSKLDGFFAKLSYIGFTCLGLQKCVVYEAGPIVGRRGLAQYNADPLRSGVNDPLNVRTAKSSYLLLATKFGEHHVGDLLNKLFDRTASESQPSSCFNTSSGFTASVSRISASR